MTGPGLTLHIELGNAAMLTDDDVIRALQRTAEQLAGGQHEGRVIDLNGQPVGAYRFTPMPVCPRCGEPADDPDDPVATCLGGDATGGDVYLTQITFLTEEPVTPDYLARRICEQAGAGALRPGEGCLLPSDPSKRLLVEDRSQLDAIREVMPNFLRGPDGTPR